MADNSAETDQVAHVRNAVAPNVRTVRGGNATIRVFAMNGGGSRAHPCGPGSATVHLDNRDVAAGACAMNPIAPGVARVNRLSSGRSVIYARANRPLVAR